MLLKDRLHAVGEIRALQEGRRDVSNPRTFSTRAELRFRYTAPTADARPTWAPTMQHVAQEGRCFVISGNRFQVCNGMALMGAQPISIMFPPTFR